MRVHIGLCAAFFSLAAGCSQAHIATTDPNITADAAMTVLIDDGFRGSVLVACGDEILLNEHYGVDPGEATVTRYWVASVTKALTAIAVMSLVEEGKLSVNDTITQLFPDAPADKKDITVFNLLTHGSGLGQNYAAEGNSDLEAAAAAVFATPLQQTPGEAFGYTNDGYSLLAMIIEKASGVSYDEYVSSAIAAPLGLEPIAFEPEQARAGEYIPPLLAPYDPPIDGLDWGFRGGHGARLSVGEIHAIANGLMQGKLVSTTSRELLHSAHFTSRSGLGVGMGWFIETDDAGRTMRWMRGTDQSGGNALAYLIDGSDLIIAAASNAGPDTQELRGWSRAARDALLPIYAPVVDGEVQSVCG